MNWLRSRPGAALVLPGVVIVASTLIAWLVIRDRGWTDEGVVSIILGVMGLSVAFGGFLGRKLTRRGSRGDAAPTPEALQPERLELWRRWLLAAVTKQRVGDGGQLAKMVSQGAAIDVSVAPFDHDAGRPRVRVGGRRLPWSEITRRRETSQGRLVILGEPGYGKTVAALTLVKHINACDDGLSVAELFPLAEWQRWRGEHPCATLGDWLAEQLTVAHRGLPAQVARQLVDERLIFPVLDGLDEIANVEHRSACVAAIDAYAERSEPHRPFVLTCRAREYLELLPDWVRHDECVVLIGLQPEQIQQRLHEQTAGRPGWDVVRERQAAGDTAINKLFASPLWLGIALQVYRYDDPGELLKLTGARARGRLWELLLENNADSYPGAGVAQVRTWLAWLAAGMQRTNRQRFMLHELYLLDPAHARNLRAFRLVVALIVTVFPTIQILILYYALGAQGSYGLVGALVGGLLVGLMSGVLVLQTDSAPAVSKRVLLQRVREQIRAFLTPKAVHGLLVLLLVALFGGLAAGLLGWMTVGLGYGLLDWLISGLVVALIILVFVVGDIIEGSTALPPVIETIEPDSPLQFGHGRPDAVLVASRATGLAVGLASVLTLGLVLELLGPNFGLIGGPLGLLVDPSGLGSGLNIWDFLFLLNLGLALAVINGFGAWLYHYWLRQRLHSRGMLPARLPMFLEWCARDERAWLRITDAYEFRHRELLEHLAPNTEHGP